jgi:hypothetical protein
MPALACASWDPIPSAWFQPIQTKDDRSDVLRQDAHDFFDQLPTVRMDVRTQAVAKHTVVYRTTTQVQLVEQPGCTAYSGNLAPPRSDGTQEPNPYLIFASRTLPNPALTFRLSELYGDELCLKVNGSVFIHDFTIAPPAREPTAAQECFRGCEKEATPRYSSAGVWTATELSYPLKPTRVEYRTDIHWIEDQAHPPYSFPLLYKSATSVLPATVTHVIVTGDANLLAPDGALLTVRYPSVPLFILHDPPGSLSKTSIEQDDSIQLAQQSLYSYANGLATEVDVGTVLQDETDMQSLFVSKNMVDVAVAWTAQQTNEVATGHYATNTLSAGYTYSQSFSTSVSRVSDLSSSSVLLHTGLLQLRESMTVKRVSATSCTVHTPFPKLSWEDPTPAMNSFMWVSDWQIEFAILPQLRQTEQLIRDELSADVAGLREGLPTIREKQCFFFQMFEYCPIPDPQDRDWLTYLADTTASIEAWTAIRGEFVKSRARAVKFDPRAHKGPSQRERAHTCCCRACDAIMPRVPSAHCGYVLRGCVCVTRAVGSGLDSRRNGLPKGNTIPDALIPGFGVGNNPDNPQEDLGRKADSRKQLPISNIDSNSPAAPRPELVDKVEDRPAFPTRSGSAPGAWAQQPPEERGFMVSFEGGGAETSFALTIETSDMGEEKNEGSAELSLGPEFKFRNVFSVAGMEARLKLAYKHGARGEQALAGTNTRTQKVHVTLGDEDSGDMFDVEVKIDPVYGTPVFITKGGQSRCPHEQGTLSRESIKAQLSDAQLTFVPPEGIARVSLLLDNQSPTQEQWSYSIGVAPGDTHGLVVNTAAEPLVARVNWQYVPFSGKEGLTKIPLELVRNPGSPYRYENVKMAITPSESVSHAHTAMGRAQRSGRGVHSAHSHYMSLVWCHAYAQWSLRHWRWPRKIWMERRRVSGRRFQHGFCLY